MERLTISELLFATKGKLVSGNENNSINDIVIDSRNANEENVFVAIVGESLDGHSFMQAAYEKGCKNFIKNQSSSIKIDGSDINLIEVEDTTTALGDISKYYKEKFNIPYIGITGSVGKTTTRDMVYSAVSSRFKTLKNQGNLNNQFGVPLTLFNLDKSYECAVIEMGMSGFNEIEYLANIVEPKIGVISNIGLSHVENLGSQEGILKAKMEITSKFDKDNILVVNGDDAFLSTLKTRNYDFTIKTFGFNKENDIYCESYELTEDNIIFICIIDGKKEEIFIPTVGEHNIYNAMAAILVGKSLGLSMEEIKNGLRHYTATEMRLDIVKNDKMTIINDTYNASPDSMAAALKILGRYNERRVAILGDMFEMGELAEYGHRLVGKSTIDNADVLITIGKDSKFIGDEAKNLGFTAENIHHFETKEDAINEIDSLLKEKDIVLVKASRGMKLEKVVEYLNNQQ